MFTMRREFRPLHRESTRIPSHIQPQTSPCGLAVASVIAGAGICANLALVAICACPLVAPRRLCACPYRAPIKMKHLRVDVLWCDCRRPRPCLAGNLRTKKGLGSLRSQVEAYLGVSEAMHL